MWHLSVSRRVLLSAPLCPLAPIHATDRKHLERNGLYGVDSVLTLRAWGLFSPKIKINTKVSLFLFDLDFQIFSAGFLCLHFLLGGVCCRRRCVSLRHMCRKQKAQHMMRQTPCFENGSKTRTEYCKAHRKPGSSYNEYKAMCFVQDYTTEHMMGQALADGTFCFFSGLLSPPVSRWRFFFPAR